MMRGQLLRFTNTLTRSSLISLPHTVHHRHFSGVRFSEDHEWISQEDGGDATVGITDYAQDSLGEIVFVEFPDIGAEFEAGDVFGQIESVKAASDLYMPVAGEITQVNEKLNDEPGLINSSPEADGWMVKIKVKDQSEVNSLMQAPEYAAYTENLQ